MDQKRMDILEPEEKNQILSTAGTNQPVLEGNERILVVDDEKAIVKIKKQLLEKLGYQVSATSSSTEALEIFGANPRQFDLVLTDYSMPDMDGVELGKKMMVMKPGIPIILLTGRSDSVATKEAEAAGFSGYLVKPVSAHHLFSAIRKVLDTPAKNDIDHDPASEPVQLNQDPAISKSGQKGNKNEHLL